MGKLLSLSQAIVFAILFILCLYGVLQEKAVHHIFSTVISAVMSYAGIYEYRNELKH